MLWRLNKKLRWWRHAKKLEEALCKVKAELSKVKANWAKKRERAELDLVNAKKEVAEVVGEFKTFKGFMTEKAQVVANFWKL